MSSKKVITGLTIKEIDSLITKYLLFKTNTNKRIEVVYDIETGLSKFVGFKPGEQYVGHKQLLGGFLVTPIICLSFTINDSKPYALVYDLDTTSCKEMIQQFDRIIAVADIVIGKNSNRFDNKHLNYQRMLYNLDGMPEWLSKTEDLETQMRRFFYMPSHSLDHISAVLGLGGKVKMDMSDWVDILIYQTLMNLKHRLSFIPTTSIVNCVLNAYTVLEYKISLETAIKRGEKALAKMIFYNGKDVTDTRTIWKYCKKHFKPRINVSLVNFNGKLQCNKCSGTNIKKNGTEPYKGSYGYQRFFCKDCRSECGKIAFRKDGTFNLNGRLT